MIRTLTLCMLAVALLYGLFKAEPLIAGPNINLTIVPQGLPGNTSSGPAFTTLSGIATHTESLRLNGATLLIDKEGNFQKTLTLPHGNVILSLTATDRFGRTRSVERTLLSP
jgi:hypothetical protein